MDALLILAGLLLMLVGLVWLIVLAFGSGLLWGWGSLLPPITLLYVGKHWLRARKAVVVFGLGFIPLVVGMALLASRDAARLEALITLSWLQPPQQPPKELDIRLRGDLNGQVFAAQQAELINGVLRLREGNDFFARREVIVRLPKDTRPPVRVDILPEDQGDLPEVEISWLLPDQDLPEARRLDKGYTLHLDLQPLPPNKLVGDFHLVLPAQYQTTLSGRLELFRDDLRYRDDKVDLTHDSQDTLRYLVTDYLQRRFATTRVDIIDLPPVAFPTRRVATTVAASIEGKPQQVPLSMEKTNTGWRVDGDRFIPLQAESENQQASPAPTQVKTPDRAPQDPFSLVVLVSTPERYIGRNMRVFKSSGGNVEGRFEGLDSTGNIRLLQQRGGAGQATFTLKPDDISRIDLLGS
ncbi:MFS transporter [Pseudomonas sp. LRF_L74]|uniref:MFS transporter n=1 Tax=Pseudomonas sp. LRF_L74 TaxID=3369422 RepID=UPI003F630997